jgi:hypothetical protein
MGCEKAARVSDWLPDDYPSRKMRNMTKQDSHVFHGIYFKIAPVTISGAMPILTVSSREEDRKPARRREGQRRLSRSLSLSPMMFAALKCFSGFGAFGSAARLRRVDGHGLPTCAGGRIILVRRRSA